MTQLPERFNHRLRREPADLLEVVRHNYQTELGSDVHATFPVVLRQSIELIMMRLATHAFVAVVVTLVGSFVTGSESVAFLAGILAAFISIILTSSEMTLGIVAVTDREFVLIKLDKKATFRSGEVIERIDILSNQLPEPRAHKGGMFGGPLAFKKEDDRGWHYAGLTDSGTGYITLLEELRTFQKSAAMEYSNDHAETELVN